MAGSRVRMALTFALLVVVAGTAGTRPAAQAPQPAAAAVKATPPPGYDYAQRGRASGEDGSRQAGSGESCDRYLPTGERGVLSRFRPAR